MNTLEEFMNLKEDGTFFIGHASALVRISGKLILFDPIWNEQPYKPFWKFVPEQIDCDSILDKVDACVISHLHQDHLSEKIISKLKCPIYIAEGRPELLNKLTKIRLDIFTFSYFKWMYCLPDVQIYFVKHPFNSIDSACFVRNAHYQMYHGNDCFLDEATCLRVSNDVGPTDDAMVPFAFIHSYPFLLQNLTEEERVKEIERLNKQSIDQAMNFIMTFVPKRVIPCGANLFYDDGADHILNSYMTSPFKISTFPSLAGSYFTTDKERLIGPLSPTTWKQYLDDELTKRQEPMDYSSIQITENHLFFLNERLKKVEPLPFYHELVINDSLTINAQTCEGKLTRTLPKEPYHRFMIDGPILRDWLNGDMTFEQVVGTRRFIYWRYPNVYSQPFFQWYMEYL